MKTIALISCAKGKKAHAAPAADLYQSQLFDGMKRYAQANADQYFILSAKHGLLDPADVIEPYDETLNAMPKAKRLIWGCDLCLELAAHVEPGDRVIILAGANYREILPTWLYSQGIQYSIPMQGLEIGQQLQFLKRAVEFV